MTRRLKLLQIDTVDRFARDGERVVPVLADSFLSVLGINDRSELATAAALLNRRICEHHMCNGVTIADPSTTYLEPDLEIAADVTILPNTTIGRRSKIGAHSEIGPNSRLVAAEIGEHVVVRDSIVSDSTLGDFVFAAVPPSRRATQRSKPQSAILVAKIMRA